MMWITIFAPTARTLSWKQREIKRTLSTPSLQKPFPETFLRPSPHKERSREPETLDGTFTAALKLSGTLPQTQPFSRTPLKPFKKHQKTHFAPAFWLAPAHPNARKKKTSNHHRTNQFDRLCTLALGPGAPSKQHEPGTKRLKSKPLGGWHKLKP